MRSVSGDSNTVLPWQVIRQDGQGNRYRVGSYATRSEAFQVADRLGQHNGDGPGEYVVEQLNGHGGTGGR